MRLVLMVWEVVAGREGRARQRRELTKVVTMVMVVGVGEDRRICEIYRSWYRQLTVLWGR